MNPSAEMTPAPNDKSMPNPNSSEEAAANTKGANGAGSRLNGKAGEEASEVSLGLPEDEEWDAETAELSKLRCASVQTEEIWRREREKREREGRRNRCADYPGLAFGSAMFGSDTMMKLNIIKNELHNIMKSQLRRVDGEVSALSARIKEVDKNLERSEHYIKTATGALADAVQWEMENRKECQEEEEEETALSQFDAQMKVLEYKLLQARQLAGTDGGGGSDDDPDSVKEDPPPKKCDEVTPGPMAATNVSTRISE